MDFGGFELNSLDDLLAFVKEIHLMERHGVDTSSCYRARIENPHLEGSFMTYLMQRPRESSEVLHSLSKLARSLRTLSKYVDNEVSHAKDIILPSIYYRGLYGLPFEVTAYIFELTVEEEQRRSHDANILRINRHFRSIALKVPKLWTRIGSDYSPKLALSRNLAMNLDIELVPSGNITHELRFIRMLEPHLHRWTSFSISVPRKSSIPGPKDYLQFLTYRLRARFKGKTFPALKTLRLNQGALFDNPVPEHGHIMPHRQGANIVHGNNEESLLTSLNDLCKGWHMPLLGSLEFSGFTPFLSTGTMENLNNVRIDLRLSHRYIWNLQRMLQFLQGLPAMEELSLDLGSTRDFSNSDDTAFTYPCLRTLEIKVDDASADALKKLLSNMNTCNIQRVVLDIKSRLCDEVGYILEEFFPQHRRIWSKVDTLICQISCSELKEDQHPGPDSILDVMCSRLPEELCHLTLEAPHFRQPNRLTIPNSNALSSWKRSPPLQSLHLLNCSAFDIHFLLGLNHAILFNDFYELELRDCPRLSLEVVEKFIPPNVTLKHIEHDWTKEILKFKETKSDLIGYSPMKRERKVLASRRYYPRIRKETEGFAL